MVQPAPYTEELNAYLNNIVQTLHSAVNQAMRHLEDDPEAVDKAIQDCKEMLDFVMAGDVKSWVN